MILAKWTDGGGILHVTTCRDNHQAHYLEAHTKRAGAVSVEIEEVDILEYRNPYKQITKEDLL